MHKRRMHILVVFALVLAAALMPATAASASNPYLYKSTVPLASVGNLPSASFEATGTDELGNQITLDHAGNVGGVVVTMSSWACESGHWNTGNCETTPGARFTWPITFSIYNAATGTPPVAGSLPGQQGTLFVHSSHGYSYCDNGAAGLGLFREDSPTSGCWSVRTPGTSPYYIPAVQLRERGCDQDESQSSDQDVDCEN